MKKERISIYPGTFDPITNGHLDIIERAGELFDRVIITISHNPDKEPLFSISERREMIEEVIQPLKFAEVDTFSGLLVAYAIDRGAVALIRGLRAISDFEYEFQMALVNRRLAKQLVTVFLMPHEKYTYINSTIVRELARFGGNVSKFVPPNVENALRIKCGADS
ncbi:MAG: pantetheine-phosphate adenylyltransferase [candidate division Zixibacteria bacterium]|nr:pantetheine-phosphate adenylyltransferase [Candidatus Tariuqbacter arcticus]